MAKEIEQAMKTSRARAGVSRRRTGQSMRRNTARRRKAQRGGKAPMLAGDSLERRQKDTGAKEH